MRGTEMASPRARGLGAALRDARIEARFGLRELGRRIGVNPALLSNWELGQRVPTPEEVSNVLGALGVTGERKAWIMLLAHGVTGPSWSSVGSQADPAHYTTLIAHERVATAVTVWAPLLIPDLLQVPDYARLVFGPDLRDKEALDQVVESRMDRNRILFGAGAVKAEMFIGSEALRNHFGDAEVMLRQTRFLKDLVGLSRTMTIRLAPSQAVTEEAFSRYALKDTSDVVYCPHRAMGVFLVGKEAASYEVTIQRLREAALSPAESLARLSVVVDQLLKEVKAQRRATDAGLTQLLTGEEPTTDESTAD
ncbi:helix-turn-helix domain-containing protein [Amycolatopsis circi]|uniref:helix-turn-helix domain-containing protein n=1 Tax=Amycolatopsis circi TaxID=871959 RepID=UPI000E23B7D4|nr:Scr1 family TA system antitoxin-like transcriptional regulator [Amycolatopsis circi]